MVQPEAAVTGRTLDLEVARVPGCGRAPWDSRIDLFHCDRGSIQESIRCTPVTYEGVAVSLLALDRHLNAVGQVAPLGQRRVAEVDGRTAVAEVGIQVPGMGEGVGDQIRVPGHPGVALSHAVPVGGFIPHSGVLVKPPEERAVGGDSGKKP
ncbi:hypothetical protein ABT112_04860 [Streptomyces sp. NPDC002055]|uniref:hypothetical protein n=1 Tax=Streptomyces sp. NPDC002055 TaxID=3154534 RepID=UPI0033249339